MTRVPGAKEILRLADRDIRCSFRGPHPNQRWRLVIPLCFGDPLRSLKVYAVLQCKTCRSGVPVVITCKGENYGIKKFESKRTA